MSVVQPTALYRDWFATESLADIDLNQFQAHFKEAVVTVTPSNSSHMHDARPLLFVWGCLQTSSSKLLCGIWGPKNSKRQESFHNLWVSSPKELS